MIVFNYDAVTKKAFVEVKKEESQLPPTMIKVEDTSNEGILKTCQEWLDSIGIADQEYRVLVTLH